MSIAFHRHPADPARLSAAAPGVLFAGGFHSSMRGDKAMALERACRASGHAYTRFDYRGHGESAGDPAAYHPGDWLDDLVGVLDDDVASDGRRRVVVGSSMGAWLAVRAALERPDAVAALLLIAAAPDFTHELLPERLDAPQRADLAAGLTVALPSRHGEPPYPVSRALMEGGAAIRVLDSGPLAIRCPVRLLHGTADEDVPPTLSERLLAALDGADASLELVDGADHRFSDARGLALILNTLEGLLADSLDPGPINH